jgi:hypothetical protein
LSQPAICSGDQFNLSFLATARRSHELVANLHRFGDEIGPTPAHPLVRLGSDHSRHCA